MASHWPAAAPDCAAVLFTGGGVGCRAALTAAPSVCASLASEGRNAAASGERVSLYTTALQLASAMCCCHMRVMRLRRLQRRNRHAPTKQQMTSAKSAGRPASSSSLLMCALVPCGGGASGGDGGKGGGDGGEGGGGGGEFGGAGGQGGSSATCECGPAIGRGARFVSRGTRQRVTRSAHQPSLRRWRARRGGTWRHGNSDDASTRHFISADGGAASVRVGRRAHACAEAACASLDHCRPHSATWGGGPAEGALQSGGERPASCDGGVIRGGAAGRCGDGGRAGARSW